MAATNGAFGCQAALSEPLPGCFVGRSADSAARRICKPLRRLTVAWVALAMLWIGPTPLALGQSAPTVSDVVAGMRVAHQRLLELPGGFLLRYRMEVEQDPKRPAWGFANVNGILAVNWPRLYVRYSGTDVDTGKPITYEADYNFLKNQTIAVTRAQRPPVNGVHLTPYRHTWSSEFATPLRLQYFVESEQKYEIGHLLKGSVMLPDAVEEAQSEYRVLGIEPVEGTPCVHLERTGYDSIWVAPERGYVVCRRDLYFGPDRPLREKTVASNLVEVANAGWFPARILQEQYWRLDEPKEYAGKVKGKRTLMIDQPQIGVTDQELTIVLPERAHVTDRVRDRQYFYDKTRTAAPFEEGIASALITMNAEAYSLRQVAVWGAVAAGGALGLALLWKNYRGRRAA